MSAVCPGCQGPSEDGGRCVWCKSIARVAAQRDVEKANEDATYSPSTYYSSDRGGGFDIAGWFGIAILILLGSAVRACA